MKTRITDMLGIPYPIIQGGLASLAYAELAAAVSNAGGLGQITATSLPSGTALREEIIKTRSLTNQPFAVNVAISQHHSVDELIDVIVEQQVPVITLTGGNPAPIFKRLEGAPIHKLVLVSAVRQAQKAEALGADAVMAVGQEGGGHIGRGDTGTMVLIPRVVDSVQIPVIASGGIADGRGLVAALALGAEGIEMGTRFVATKECIAHPSYKQALINGEETDTVVIKRTLGAPGRVINSKWAHEVLQAEARSLSESELWPYINGDRNRTAALDGNLDEGYGWAGQSVGLIHSLPTVAELITEMLTTARLMSQRLASIEF